MHAVLTVVHSQQTDEKDKQSVVSNTAQRRECLQCQQLPPPPSPLKERGMSGRWAITIRCQQGTDFALGSARVHDLVKNAAGKASVKPYCLLPHPSTTGVQCACGTVSGGNSTVVFFPDYSQILIKGN